jgi:HSP20 family protein
MAETRETQSRQERSEPALGLQRTGTSTPDRLRQRDPFDALGFGPFSLFRRMQEDMDRLFESVWAGGRSSIPATFGQTWGAEWAPAIEAFQRGSEFVVRAEVPGLSRDDLTVEIGEDALTLQGERKHDHQEEREGTFRSERSYGRFSRVIPLPEGAIADSATANFKDGVLEIVVPAPSHEVRRGRRIEIGQGSAEKGGER